MDGANKPLKIAILAMGGQGGGVLANWLIEAAERAGYLAQSTAVPGVAQRTGATVYYLEIAPRDDIPGEQSVLALMPVPGHVDVVIAGELAEAGRAALRGLITSARTVAIVSTHRDYAIGEKTAPGDGRVESGRIAAAVDASAKRFVGFDMAALAEETGSVISSVLLGAIAGAAALPMAAENFREVIRAAGVAVEANLKGFDAGVRGVRRRAERDTEIDDGDRSGDVRFYEAGRPSTRTPGIAARAVGDSSAPDAQSSDSLLSTSGFQSSVSDPQWSVAGKSTPPKDIRSLLDRVREQFPEESWQIVSLALRRLVDYQDSRYAADYLERLQPIRRLDDAEHDYRLTLATARHLVLGMAYEDVMRVADLKTRAQRFAQVREEVGVADGQVVSVEEYMHPRVEEICDMLPARFGAWCMKTSAVNRFIGWFCRKGRRIRTTSLSGFLLLYLLARLRPFRRRTLRFQSESAALDQWLQLIASIAPEAYDLAVEIAECRRLVKGYGETHARGLANYHRLIAEVQKRRGAPDAAAAIRNLRERMLSEPETISD